MGIDDGELDWKVIAIAASDEKASEINDVDDIEKYYPGTVSGIREWFRWYKSPTASPPTASTRRSLTARSTPASSGCPRRWRKHTHKRDNRKITPCQASRGKHGLPCVRGRAGGTQRVGSG